MSYQPVPVSAAQSVAMDYHKDVVVIIALDRTHGLTHCTTYAVYASDKAYAHELGERLTAAAGAEVSQANYFEDFRDPAKIPAGNDRAEWLCKQLQALAKIAEGWLEQEWARLIRDLESEVQR